MVGLDPTIHAVPRAPASTTRVRNGPVRPGLIGVDRRIKSDDDSRGGAAMPVAWVYIMTNRANGTLYVGVTSDLVKRAWQHREGVVEGFSSRHELKMLVWFEGHDEMLEAIRREKALKNWLRAWKVRLILEANPGWADLYPSLL